MYFILRIKHIIENLILLPFISIGRLIAKIKPLEREYDVFFLFPFFHTGGVEKVHYQIAQAVGSRNCIIFFTRKSYNENYLAEFIKSGCIIKDISKYTDNKVLYFFNFIYRGIVSGYINSQRKKPLVFNGQSNFGYKISPCINKKIAQIELIHAYNTFSKIRIPFIKYYHYSLTISRKVIEDHFQLYNKYKIPEKFKKSFGYIENKIELPKTGVEKDYYSPKLTVLYVGRGTEEKRVHLVALIAKKIRQHSNVTFELAGDVKNSIPENLHQYCVFLGDLSMEELNKVYNNAHILLITSSTESGPFVFMEGMARGLGIISTQVGYIPDHIHNFISGFVLTDILDENKIIEESAGLIEYLYVNRSDLEKMGKHNIGYAFANFGIEQFNKSYQNLFKDFQNEN